MSQYTNADVEQVVASIARVDIDGMDGDSWDRVVIHAALDYAATQRQQAARVDDADVRLLMTVLSGEHGGDHADDGCDVCSAFTRIEAALSAQPAPPTYTHGADGSVMQDNSGDPGYWTTQPAPERRGEVAYAERLARALWRDHYADVSPDFEPMTGDLYGLLTQIDNMITGWKAHRAAPVGVPDAAINILRRSRDDADLVPLYRQAMRDAVAQLETFNLIAAAPSAPQGTQQWVE